MNLESGTSKPKVRTQISIFSCTKLFNLGKIQTN